MADISPTVSRALARYLVALVALLEAKRGAISEDEHSNTLAAFNRSLLALSDADRDALEQLAGSLASTLAVSSARQTARA